MIASLRLPGVLRDSASVGLGLAIVKAAGAAKIVLMARAFGASDELDAYLVAFLLPSFASEVVVGSLALALIPSLIALRETKGRAVMESVRANLLGVVISALALIALLLLIAAPLILRLIASDFGPAKLALAQGLFRVLLPVLPLSGLSIVWRAALTGEERFTSASLAPVATPALAVAALWLGGTGVTVWILAAAHITGLMLELVWLAVAMSRNGLGLWPRWNAWDAQMRTVLMQYLPLVAVAAAGNSGVLIDQSMAATLAPGSVSALNYGTKLVTVTSGVIGGALSTAALPRVSKMTAAEDWAGLRRALARAAALVLVAVVPATLLMVALSEEMVRVVFQRGALTEAPAQLIASVQRWALLQLPPAIFSAILLRFISSFRVNHLLLRVAAMGFGLNIVLDLFLKQHMGLPGIALASALVQLATAGYVLILIKRRIP